MRSLVPRRSGAHPNMTLRYADELALFRTRWAKGWLAVLVATWLLLPIVLDDEFWLSVLNYAGIAAIGAIGLNLLTGYTGQISLGHAFFLGAGAYVAARVGDVAGMPLPIWLVAAFAFGAAVGGLIGPFALRLRGPYLAIVTLGLVFLGEHLFRNMTSVTGGNNGIAVAAPVDLGFIDLASPEVGGTVYTLNQGYFWLIWALVGLVALLAKNVVRTRPGRALQAIRDRDVAAAVIGVSLWRYKVGAFALSSGLAAMAGALYGSFQQYVSPDEWTLFVSIQYIAIIIVGGVGTIFGAILGAIVLGGLPAIIEEYSDRIPGVAESAGESGISVFSLNQAIFGVLIVAFLVFEPRGLASLWLRVKAYFRAWPFSY